MTTEKPEYNPFKGLWISVLIGLALWTAIIWVVWKLLL